MQAKEGGVSSTSIKINISDPLSKERRGATSKVGKCICREPYDVFGPNAVWAILTVVVVFEQTVGGTVGKGLNRALGSIAAGVLALLVAQIALIVGEVAQPIIIGFSIFFLGSLATFIKQWPSMREYEYGFRVYIFTFCLIVVSAYRLGTPVRTTVDRLYSISIGGAAPMLVSAVIFPSWASEQLHQQIVKNFEYVADSLEECVKLYLEDAALAHARSTNIVHDMEYCDGEPAFKRYTTALNSSAKEETLAKSAKWEPPHGRFKLFFYPWSQYVKVGAVLRHCAYEVTALHRCLHSELQAPQNLRKEFAKELRDASTHAAKLIRELGSNIDKMQSSSFVMLLKKVHTAAERLQNKIDTHSHLVLPKTSKELETKPSLISYPSEGLCNGDNSCDGVEFSEMKKISRRLHSWPSLEVDMLEEGHMDDHAHEVPKITGHESINALSFITFASLLIEFLARLDHLVRTVEQLGKLAKFSHG
ncbi:aluminum-activated malate transporter 9 isoform X2 [Cryptomeria japonica]|uniref:aluminum-activated malate transporter 9 isoform X2 n=1 Tax=Cryptomeria japonica TaxID=3369 RepID=UPI0025AD58B2|nr:aluminum-activated malate transporter 9 isoform X2 [Cryptomeria japonica]